MPVLTDGVVTLRAPTGRFTLSGRSRQDGVVGVGRGRPLDDGTWHERLAGDAGPDVRRRRG